MKFWAHGAWWPINRPHLVSWADDENYGLGVSWGNGNSDPVWSLGVIFQPSAHRFLARLADWLEDRQFKFVHPDDV